MQDSFSGKMRLLLQTLEVFLQDSERNIELKVEFLLKVGILNLLVEPIV